MSFSYFPGAVLIVSSTILIVVVDFLVLSLGIACLVPLLLALIPFYSRRRGFALYCPYEFPEFDKVAAALEALV